MVGYSDVDWAYAPNDRHSYFMILCSYRE